MARAAPRLLQLLDVVVHLFKKKKKHNNKNNAGCVTGDDPGTRNVTETDCEGVNGGEPGNLCHVDCSNRGTCDHSDGTCKCIEGYQGLNCGIKVSYG
mgnify:CR=1 FL=1